MAEAASMASPVAGARILHERIGKSAIPSEESARAVSEEAEVSVPLSLVLSWTSPRTPDENSVADRGGDA